MPSVKVSLTLINKSFCLGRASEGTSLCTVGHECILNCNLNPSFFPRYFSTVYVFICDRCVDVIYSWHNAQASAVWPGSAGPRAWKCACIVLSCFPVFSSPMPQSRAGRAQEQRLWGMIGCLPSDRLFPLPSDPLPHRIRRCELLLAAASLALRRALWDDKGAVGV